MVYAANVRAMFILRKTRTGRRKRGDCPEIEAVAAAGGPAL